MACFDCLARSRAETAVLLTCRNWDVAVASRSSRATAIKLHKLGATLAITDVGHQSTAETLELCGGRGHFVGVMDVAHETAVAAQVREIAAAFGHLDHVFNCAGVNPTAMPLIDTPSAYFDKLLSVNLKGVCKSL